MNATTKTTAHSNCLHAATKTERAKCRRLSVARLAGNRPAVVEIVASYYGCSAELEEIMGQLHRIDPKITTTYYDGTGDAEEIIALAARYGA